MLLTRHDKMGIKTLTLNDAATADTHIKLLIMSLYSKNIMTCNHNPDWW